MCMTPYYEHWTMAYIELEISLSLGWSKYIFHGQSEIERELEIVSDITRLWADPSGQLKTKLQTKTTNPEKNCAKVNV